MKKAETFRNSLLLTKIFIFLCVLSIGCSNEASPLIKNEQTDVSNITSSAQKTIDSVNTSIFDPRKIKVGDKIGKLTVESYERIMTDVFNDAEYVTQAFIQFSGEVKVTGSFKRHPLDREYLAGQVVFQMDDNVDFPRMKIRDKPQELRQDEWVVLASDDKEMKQKFGPPGSEGKATIIISNYRVQYGHTEISDSARLREVISIERNNNKEPLNEKSIVKWLRFDQEGHSTERKLIKEKFASEIEEIERGDHGNVKKIGISISSEDLNGDGKNEIIVALMHPYFSGYQANSLLYVYTTKDGKLDQEISFNNANITIGERGKQQDMGIIDNPESEWKDIVINDNLWSWDGEKYDLIKNDFLTVKK
ncbi:FG-GAP repeat protein [Paenibacillus oleatilyticus]|uniref:FG-GAP repeat protein n=1 Tax=Paenibacillus oleatilyticus TaxID=2594886 RepID=UPI001C1F4FA2|nr:hypothetical protein [Paenibacillus oleatilyticus]MBU7314282.1 hypothetical protein [Paenibacillus oleatilyticus]